ncbi:spermidine/putrescine ABC transporter permease PotB [soil metagenome]
MPRAQGRSFAAGAMIWPVIAWLFIFVVIPAIILLIYSFCDRDEHGEIVFSFTLANYRRAFEPVYAAILWRSIDYALATTLICAIAGYPVAYFIARSSPRSRDWLLLAVMIPFWTSFVIRTYAMITILSEEGPLSSALQWMRIISQPMDVLYTPGAVLAGLVYTYLPFMILPIYAAVQKLDNALIEAAHDLGAGPVRAFWRIILPLTWSGVAAGIVLVFVPAVAMFAVSDLLGGGKTPMIGNVIESQFVGLSHDWPFGAALGVLLLLMFIIAMAIFGRRSGMRVSI